MWDSGFELRLRGKPLKHHLMPTIRTRGLDGGILCMMSNISLIEERVSQHRSRWYEDRNWPGVLKEPREANTAGVE